MRATRPLVFGVLLSSGLIALGCGSEKDGNYSPNVVGQGGGSAASAGTGCSGATGGAGGKGGNGGGGAGGPSIGVAYAGAKPTRTGGSITVATIAALGGASGSGSSTGTGAGAPGVLAEEKGF